MSKLAEVVTKDAYQKGCEHFEEGFMPYYNPYSYSSEPQSEFMQWKNGWFDTQATYNKL